MHSGPSFSAQVCTLLQMVEISRVLKPGGIFVASTFLKTFSALGEVFGDETIRPLNQVTSLTLHKYAMHITAAVNGLEQMSCSGGRLLIIICLQSLCRKSHCAVMAELQSRAA